MPTGEWAGAEPAIFRDQEAHVDLEIESPIVLSRTNLPNAPSPESMLATSSRIDSVI